jgi:CheY-like chemotaxis protein
MPPRILLADDSVTVQKVIELTFSDEGMDVVAVGDGRQAIERLDADPPDVVLADVSMPERDGYEVAEHVKRTPALAHIPVVLMTGAFEQLDEARARDVGCDGVLAKPFEPQMVITMVRELLAKRAAKAAEQSPAEAPVAAPGVADGYPFEPGTPAGQTPRTLDDFFDRIDEALNVAPAVSDDPGTVDAVQPPIDEASASPGRVAVEAEAVPVAQTAAAVPPPSPSPLADAFSELLADELGESPLPPSWGRVAPPPTPAREASPIDTDALVEQVANRVVARLSTEVLRAEVAKHVIEVAERLVREEIERIKGNG